MPLWFWLRCSAHGGKVRLYNEVHYRLVEILRLRSGRQAVMARDQRVQRLEITINPVILREHRELKELSPTLPNSQQSHAAPLRSIRARLWNCDFQVERAPCLSETSCANAGNHKSMGPIAKGLHGFATLGREIPRRYALSG